MCVVGILVWGALSEEKTLFVSSLGFCYVVPRYGISFGLNAFLCVEEHPKQRNNFSYFQLSSIFSVLESADER